MFRLSSIVGSPRGTRDLFRRSAVILGRFGVTPRKMEAMLNSYVDLTSEFNCRPTFPVTAVILMRHPGIMKSLHGRGAEVAIHGYIHMDHKLMSLKEQERDFQKAMRTFESCGVPYVGFRGPYLRSNSATLEALSRLKFAYDSSDVVCWSVIDPSDYSRSQLSNYMSLLQFYEAKDADSHLSLPRFHNGLALIPVSLPDDESMIGRLGIRDKQRMTSIWRAILESTYERGELFTVQLHHERVLHCDMALRAVLGDARGKTPQVWIATLAEIADWWSRRGGFKLDIRPQGQGKWRVEASCCDEATVLARYCAIDETATDWDAGYRVVKARAFTLESQVRPAVGVAPGTSPAAIEFLKSEGYVVEVSDNSGEYGLYFNDLAEFSQSDELPTVRAVAESSAPLVRFWRWPHEAKSALSVTGDIDSITLLDFAIRVFEVWRQKLISRDHS